MDMFKVAKYVVGAASVVGFAGGLIKDHFEEKKRDEAAMQRMDELFEERFGKPEENED